MLDIHTVGAGGGSIAWIDEGGALRVGPRSAGADPGPACYGRGGTLPTVTDANLVLGRLDAKEPLAGGLTLDRRRAPSARSRPSRAGSAACARRRRGSSRWPTRRWCGRSGWSASSRGTTRAGSSWSPSAAPARCTPAASPTSLGIRRIRVPGGQRRAVGARHRRRASAGATASRRRPAAGGADGRRRPRRCVPRLPRERGARRGGVGRPALPRPGVRAERRRWSRGGRCPARFHRRHRQRFGFDDPDGEIELINLRLDGGRPGAADDARAGCRGSPPVRGPATRAAGRRDAVGGEGLDRAARRPTARGAWRGDDRPGLAAGDGLGAARRRRGDGRGARPRRPLGQHQGAARLLDGRVRPARADDRAGRAHARASGGDARRGRRLPRAEAAPRRRDGGQRPLHRRHRTCPTSRWCRWPATSGCWSRGPTTPTSAGCRRPACRSGARELYQEGLIIPPVRLRPDVERLMMANMRNPRERLADLRAQIAVPPHRRSERLAELAKRFGARPVCCGAWTSCTRPARGGSRRRSAGCRTAPTARRDVMEGDGIIDRRHPDRGRRHDPGQPDDRRLRRHRAAAAGQRQLPDRRHPLRGLLRRADGLRP